MNNYEEDEVCEVDEEYEFVGDDPNNGLSGRQPLQIKYKIVTYKNAKMT